MYLNNTYLLIKYVYEDLLETKNKKSRKKACSACSKYDMKLVEQFPMYNLAYDSVHKAMVVKDYQKSLYSALKRDSNSSMAVIM